MLCKQSCEQALDILRAGLREIERASQLNFTTWNLTKRR